MADENEVQRILAARLQFLSSRAEQQVDMTMGFTDMLFVRMSKDLDVLLEQYEVLRVDFVVQSTQLEAAQEAISNLQESLRSALARIDTLGSSVDELRRDAASKKRKYEA